MDKKQAFKNLSLPANADIETIRIRFASLYTQSDEQYDKTLTAGMKAIHEQHLRELEEAYKVATDNPIISDMGAILSLGKGYIEENGETIGGGDSITTDEALAFFALYSHDSPTLAEERYTQYITELERALDTIGLEAAKEPYRQEINKAKDALHIAINYLLANQMMASIKEIEQIPKEESTADIEEDKPNISETSISRKVAKRGRYRLYATIAVLLLAVGYYIGKQNETDNKHNSSNESAAPDSLASKTTVAETSQVNQQQSPTQQQSLETNETVATTEVEIKTPVPSETKTEKTEPVPTSDREVISNALTKYAPDYVIKVTLTSIEATKENERWFIPLSDIDTIDNQGRFVCKSSRLGFLFQGNQRKKTSEDLKLTGASNKVKEQVIRAIRGLAPPTKEAPPTTSTPKPKEIIKEDKETDSLQLEVQSTIPTKDKTIDKKDKTLHFYWNEPK